MEDRIVLGGYGFFAVWASLLSYDHWHSPFWAALSGTAGLFYLLYAAFAF